MFFIEFQQVDGNVVATGSGSVNTAGLIRVGTDRAADFPLIVPQVANYGTGTPGQPITNFTRFSGLTGPSSFGPGGLKNASTFSGGPLILLGRDGILDLPVDYISGATFSNSDTFNNATFSNLGLSVGTYTYTFGSGADADSLVVRIGAAVPSLQRRQ